MGGDESVVAAARVSNDIDYEAASKGEEKDAKLIQYLVKHRHGTPFEHATFQFYIQAPMFVRSEWHRHRMASYNEVSGRYVKFEPVFYIPDKFRVQAKTNKQGSAFPTEDDIDASWLDVESWNDEARWYVEDAVEYAFQTYEQLLDMGVAKEQARMVLPLNLYTKFYMTCNARGLMNFLSLRAAEDAQWEIRQYANAVVDIFEQRMPITAKAWRLNNFIVP
jgi:thymidylate synthase (FAD)